ncbi:MAG: PEP-utilizing enzyme [Solirubrobacteraceae bacterium]
MSSQVIPDSWDPLHAASPVGWHWTRGNIGEALPGVLTPLTWSLWEVAAEAATRGAFHALGAATEAESLVPGDRSQRFIRAFHGRGSCALEFLCEMGDRLPGTSGAAIAEQVFGKAPPSLVGTPERRRYPIIAVKLPYTTVRAPGVLRAHAAETERWWRAQTRTAPGLDLPGSVELFTDAAERFRRSVALQATTLFCVVQPIYDTLGRLAARAGIDDLTGLASGYGSVPETAVVADLWRVSRGELELADVTRRHGFHGPREGEMSARVWREDDEPLHRLIAEYAAMPDAHDPLRREAELRFQRGEVERRLLAALPRPARPAGRSLLAIAGRVIPLRGIAKDSYLQATDVIRAAVRRYGLLLAAEGVLEDPDHAFFLTDTEIEATLPASRRSSDDWGREIAELVQRRRDRAAQYGRLELPTQWVGDPVPLAAGADARTLMLHGVGVSPGVVEGVARVVTDPSFADVAPGELLIAPATDPSWSSIMFLSAALVVDIGGALSHVAIVARELGVPCVVNTGSGTRDIRTGDRCRVDGTAGTVQILERAASQPIPPPAPNERALT